MNQDDIFADPSLKIPLPPDRESRYGEWFFWLFIFLGLNIGLAYTMVFE